MAGSPGIFYTINMNKTPEEQKKWDDWQKLLYIETLTGLPPYQQGINIAGTQTGYVQLPIPAELSFLRKGCTNFGFEFLGLKIAELWELYLAFAGTGVKIPNIGWRLRFCRPMHVKIEPSDDTETATLPDYWREGIIIQGDPIQWIGKRAATGIDLTDYVDVGDGWIFKPETGNTDMKLRQILNEEPHVTIKGPIPPEFGFLRGDIIDLGWENLNLDPTDYDEIRKALFKTGTGVRIPKSSYRLRSDGEHIFIEQAKLTEKVSLPDNWKQAVYVITGNDYSWVGKLVRRTGPAPQVPNWDPAKPPPGHYYLEHTDGWMLKEGPANT